MKRNAFRTVLLALLCAASPLAAAPAATLPDPAALKAMSDEQLGKGFMDALQGQPTRSCEAALYSEELKRRGKFNPATVWIMHAMRADCQRMDGKPGAALASFTAAEAAMGDDVPPDLRMSIEADTVRLAAFSRDWDAFKTHSLHVAERGWPEEFAGLDPEISNITFWQSPQANRDQIAVAFARSSAFSSLPEKLQTSFVTAAVKPLLASGEKDRALALALHKPDPETMLDQLINREYEFLWPQLAEAAGPRLSLILPRTVARAESEHKAAPGNDEKLSQLALAYLAARRFDDVVRLANGFDHSEKAMRSLGEHKAWTLNAAVTALDQLGRRGEGDALFDALVASPLKDRGWLVNFVINRADRLVTQGRWALALPAAEKAVEVAATHGSPYARQIAAADRYCAAIKLNPARAELAGWWDQIAKSWADNVGSAIQAAQCKGDDAAARRFIADGLADGEARPQLLRTLQPREAQFFRDEGNMFAEPRLLLEGQAELQAQFARYGRTLPPDLMPSGPATK